MADDTYDPQFARRMRTANAAVGDRPEMALTLANSDLSDGEINMVGGFTHTLENSQLVALARMSGARTELTPEDRSQLDAMGVDYQDVNNAPDNDERNWLERIFDGGATALANTGEFLADLPGIGELFRGMMWLNQAAKLPARILSSAIDQENDDEIDAAMEAQGYDPGNAWDYIQFMTNQGNSLYHDLDGLRETYGDRLVDLAIEQQYDPEKFAETFGDRDPEIQELIQSDEFAEAADRVARKHISPGRDIARLILPESVEDSAWFTGISGVVDGAYTLILDPTLMVGKAAFATRRLDASGNAIVRSSRVVDEAGNVVRNEAGRVVRQPRRGPTRLDRWTGVTALTRVMDAATRGRFRMGLRDAADVAGIRALLDVKRDANGVPILDAAGNQIATHTIGKHAQQFLHAVREFDEAVPGSPEQAAIFARLNARHPALMPLFDEVRGHRIILPTPIAPRSAEVNARLDELDELAALPGVQAAVTKPVEVKIVKTEAKAGRAGAAYEARVGDRVIGQYRNGQGSVGGGGLAPMKHKDWKAQVRDSQRSEPPPPPAAVITDMGPSIDGKLVDVNGIGHFYNASDPIRTLDDFADYFASTTAMLRLAHGVAAQREILLPGRVAIRQRIAGARAAQRQGRSAQRNDKKFEYNHARPGDQIPDEIEEGFQRALDNIDTLRAAGQIDEAEHALRGARIYDEMRGQSGWWAKRRAKTEQRWRRISSLLPTVQAIDLTSAGSIEQVRRFARLYMNKTEADRLTAIYAGGDLGRRRTVLYGIIEQTLHASGLTRSAPGLKHVEKFHADQVAEAKRAYGMSGTDVIVTASGERHVALLPSQISERVLIPDFRSLQYLSSKLAVGGMLQQVGHLRSIATSEAVDAVSSAIKLGWITTPAGGLRNALDEIANAVLRADGASMLRGRVAYSKATAEAKAATKAEIKRAVSLQARVLTSIPRALRGLPRTVNDVFVARILGRMMQFTHQPIDDLAVKHARELVDGDMAQYLNKTVTGSYYINDAFDPNAEALAIHGAGLHARQVVRNGEKVKYEFQGYDQVALDDAVGLDNFAHNLGMNFQDLTSPAHVALRGITQGRDALTDVVEYMQTPAMRHFVANAEIFGVTRSGRPVATAEDQLEAIENYAERLIANVTMLVAGRGAKREGDLAAGVPARYEFDITQPNWWRNVDEDPNWVPPTPGPINPELTTMLLRGDIPDAAWLKQNLKPEEMPSHIVAKVFAPVNPKHVGGTLLQGYTHMLSVGYQYMVTNQIRALSRNPMMASAYDQARRNLAGYEAGLVERGFTAEIAEKIAQRASLVQAEQLVIRSIDDPTMSTQYAMLARNFHAFARAQEDWLRRWGRTIRDNPQLLQRAQLYLHGAQSAGLVERDDEGNLIFTYPGSGQIINMMGRISSILPGVENPVKLPVVPDLTSRLIFLNPSLDNPAGFSAMPLLSIPFDYMASLTGSDYALIRSSMDRVINGELGAGREWYEKLLPGWANRIYQGVINDEDPASQYTSALMSAAVNLEAAGRTPAADAPASEIARYQADLKAQVQNQMIMRAIFGFVLPAAPSLPENDVRVDNERRIAEAEARGDTELAEKLRARDGEMVLSPSYVWQQAGVSTLTDEARRVFGSMDYEEALVWWAENHPGELVYQVGVTPKTEVGESEAQAPATIAAAKWLQENDYLRENYGQRGGVMTYFMPQGEGTEGDFSMDAYRAQLELDIRQYKDFDQFFEDIVIQRGEALYYDTKDDYDSAITEATAVGNTLEVRRLEDEWSVVKQTILGSNPLLREKFAEYATSGVARERTVRELNRLLEDPQAVTAIGPQAAGVAELLYAQRVYEAERQAVHGERGYYANSKREAAKAEFQAAIDRVLEQYPGLGDLVRGAFRVPN